MIRDCSLCVCIGNTSTIDNEILLKYCSRYGRIRLYQIQDSHLVEFENIDEMNSFLQVSNHRIDSVVLEVKLYKDLPESLNFDRKIYIGPIDDRDQLNSIIDSYKSIDQNLISKVIENKYLLIEFTNDEFREKILDQNSTKVFIHGLNEQTTKTDLLNYFEQQTTILSYEIDSKSAMIEFENQQFADELLHTSILSLNGTDLRISKSPLRRTVKNESQQPEIQTQPTRIIETKLELFTRHNLLENQLTQIRLEYENKFRQDRLVIEHEFHRLIDDQRKKFDRLENIFSKKKSKYSTKRKR